VDALAADRPSVATSQTPPFLRLDGVSKVFGAKAAVDNVSLRVARGEFFALLGPSGCGKTTLLRMLAGFEEPSAGSVSIDGIDMAGVPPYRRPVNMMFQSYALFPHMSVADNVAFGLRQEGVPAPRIRERVRAMLDLVQIGGLAERRPNRLSGGEKQRVALARALVKEPKLLLLDEPLGALDRKLREQTQFELVRIQRQIGITFVVVTHDQEEAMTLASRIAVMEAGRLRQIGTPGEIYETPNCRFVADFIGAVNLFPGIVTGSSGGKLAVSSAETGCTISVAEAPPLPPGTAVAIALRPEKLTLSPVGPGSRADTGTNATIGTVRDIAYLGETSIYRIELGSGKLIRASLLNADRLAGPRFARTEPVRISWAEGAGIVLQQ
jgi:putrescine transport system ATP-binding protein